ncbi:hypothetical protein Q2T46_13465 [Thermoanaerobacterium sp. CMT5567-10]|uniref:hypothetical protein n=1 Tax=Thermoanaerobacterium sp. CMT5567-10 TaxID=3061989 RepID=UPI0026E00749|nr:hypothetical protein [Thermoanaerobacterium sp. CMT5567-10]WKV08523.1 hypothetical protein Q2T46_13465 [Thermoanaerobacterium sp. CMT5567-10]
MAENKKNFILVFFLMLSILFLLANAHISSGFYTRFTDEVPVKYKVNIVNKVNNLKFSPGQNAILKLRLVNEGSYVWNSSEPQPVLLSYNILDSNLKAVKSDLGNIVIPGEIYYKYFVDVYVPITAPNVKGAYYIELNLKKGNKVVYVPDEKIKIEVR